MPILLDDISSITNKVAPKVNPHFFSKELTGQGKARGLINEHLRPGRYALGRSRGSVSVTAVDAKAKSSSSAVTTYAIPFAPLTTYSTNDAIRIDTAHLPVPASAERFHVTAAATKLDVDVYVDLTPQGAILVEDGSGDKINRQLDVLYRMEVYVVPVGASPAAVPLVATPPRHTSGQPVQSFAVVDFSYAPLDDVETLIAEASRHHAPNQKSVFVDTNDLAAWMADYDLYDRICRQAEVWNSDKIGEIVADHIENLFRGGVTPTNEVLQRLALQLRYLESYNVPLDAYRRIYSALESACPQDMVSTFTKQNMSLLLNGTMAILDSLKQQLTVPPVNAQAVASVPSKFSQQQRQAITTQEPLSLTMAGAGSGKSSVILARIDHLVACGVNPREITVLSFTNAAADNILAKNPAVSSMTIARMVMEIYQLNHPTHQISTIETIVNTMDIFYPNDDMARAFRRRLLDVKNNVVGATTALNAFVEMHFDKVLTVLDRIEQTCLELQIIIAYQKIDTMVEPPHLAGRFLIVDEVQDNSIFEFIYLLRYVAKHHQNMFIVGDASQTLYEFRSANPKALNALEGSGVFAVNKLTTNYRSNQEILDFANVHLADIEANSLAQIRLEANSLAKPTAKSFQERVQLEYVVAPSQTAARQDLPGLMRNKVKPYVDACLARGEKVAFLAYKKVDLDIIEQSLKEMYPSLSSGGGITNITSKRRRPSTVFSQFVKLFWNDVLQVKPDQAAFAIRQTITDNLDQLAGRYATKAAPAIMGLVSDWWISQGAAVQGWAKLVAAGGMTRDAFFDSLMHNLLDFEIDQNGIKQNVLNRQNRERKETHAQGNASLIVSTIHGAKGLEFDNVVVLHQYDTTVPEDQKRLFYVAFTRAMKSEFVLSFGKQKKARIITDYELIVTALDRRERLDHLRAQGIDLDTMTDEEIDALVAASGSAPDDDTSDAPKAAMAAPTS